MKRGRQFVNKEHQLDWMVKGGASELNAMQPLDAKMKGGIVSGQQAVLSGRLLVAAYKGGARSREIAENFRARQTGVKDQESK